LRALLWKGGLLFLCLSFLSGCAPMWPRRIPRKILSTADLLQRIQARNQRIQSIRAQARVTINLGENRFTLEELIIVKKPASLRVEALSLIGQPLLYLTTDGTVFEALIPAENRLYRGGAAMKYLSAFSPFCGGGRKIISLMAGEADWADDERLAAHYSQRDNVYIVNEDTPEGSTRIFWIHPFHFALVRAAELDELQNAQWEILFANFRKRDGIPFPTDIEFRNSNSGSRIKMHLLEWEINPSLGEGAFRLDVPKGVEIIEMK
jgi:outer membrane lipoprotein-sorting protein